MSFSKALFIISNVLGMLISATVFAVACIGIATINSSSGGTAVRWWSSADCGGCNPWTWDLNPFFALAIFCVYVCILMIFSFSSEFCLLVFQRLYYVGWFFRFFKFLEGHALFYMVYASLELMGILCLGIAGNTGIFVGSWTMFIGVILLIFAIVIRIKDGSSAGRGEYGLFRFPKLKQRGAAEER